MCTPINYIKYYAYRVKRYLKKWWCVRFHYSRRPTSGFLYWALDGYHWVECTKCGQIHAVRDET